MMGYIGYSNLKTLIKNTTGLKIDSQHYGTCTCCLKSKLRKRPFGQRQRVEREGEILYLDLVPSIKLEGYNQMRGYISITDDYTTGTEIGCYDQTCKQETRRSEPMTHAEQTPKITCLTKRPTDRSDGRTVELGRHRCVYKDRSLKP